MTKYLLLDHAGVLGQALDEVDGINESIINKLNQLVNEYDYKILFHSSNNLAGQLRLLARLQDACSKKKLHFPQVKGIAVRDLLAYGNIASEHPKISDHQGIPVAVFGVKKEGKACIREALSVMLNITPADRGQSIVFDDDLSHIEQAKKEGYKTQYIGGADGLTFEKALARVLFEQT